MHSQSTLNNAPLGISENQHHIANPFDWLSLCQLSNPYLHLWICFSNTIIHMEYEKYTWLNSNIGQSPGLHSLTGSVFCCRWVLGKKTEVALMHQIVGCSFPHKSKAVGSITTNPWHTGWEAVIRNVNRCSLAKCFQIEKWYRGKAI